MMNVVSLSGRERPAFLASVTGPQEARTALDGGADLIDCKNPSEGALGALAPAAVRRVVNEIDGRAPVSATIGDIIEGREDIVAAVSAMAATGVDFVKIGFFGGADDRVIAGAIARLDLGRARPVAVLMADRQPDKAFVPVLAGLGFAAVMLDTCDKSAGPLTGILPARDIESFVDAARTSRIASGLAGSLRRADIPRLSRLRPDILGFRGALCDGGRQGAIDAARVSGIRAEIERISGAPARSVA